MPEFFILAAISLVGVILVITFYLARRLRAVSLRARIRESEYLLLQGSMNESQSHICYWSERHKKFYHPPKLKELLGLNQEYELSLDSFISVLGPTSFSPFQKALQHLREFGGDFNLTIPLENEQTMIHVSGRRFCVELPVNGSFTENDEIYAITIYNLTPFYQEQALQLQSAQTRELEFMRMVCDLSPMAVWARDRQGRVSYCNQPFAGSLETSASRVVAENLELIPSYTGHGTYDLYLKSVQEGQKQIIRTHAVMGGERRFLEVAEIIVPELRSSVGYAVDLTELEEVQQEFQQTSEGHREIMEMLSTAVVIYGSDSRLSYFNHAYVKLFDCNESWLYTKPTLPEVLENFRERHKIAEQADFQAHKRSRMELFNTLFQPIHEITHRPDGRVLRMIIAPYQNGGIIYLFDDITDTLALERGYKTLVAVQRETLDNLYEGIAVFGTDSRLRLVNPSLLSIWRLSAEEVEIGAHMNDLFKKIEGYFMDYERAHEMRAEVLKFINSRSNSQGDFSLLDERVIRYTYVPLPDGSHLFSFVDVSSQKEFERSLQQRTYNLETTEKIKNNLLSHISYELKSPINTIVGFGEILLNGYFGELNEKQMDYCKGMTDSADRLMNLINDILDLASIEAGTLNLNYQETSLTSIIVTLESLVQNHVKDQGLELITSINSKHEHIVIDPLRLKHALFNILNNAIKFTPAGGSINIRVQDAEDDNHLIEIIIQDTGVGISQADQERIFHMFEQGIKSEQRGVGIGLTLVKSLINLHKGTIHIESSIGVGTKVSCRIPVFPLIAANSSFDLVLKDVHGAA